ncbi:MAG TPA: A24 family peptidase [Bryobacteraceae bacterium]|nr:A24 family peptidase [Bryobacteraceae bacterium]
MSLTFPPPGVQAILLTLVLGAAVYDVRYRRIPNWLTVGGVLIGLALNTFMYQGWPGLRMSLAGFGVGFGVYVALYALRAMGAGDVKLMAAVGSMVGWEDWFGIFLITAVIGGAMALMLVVAKKRLAKTIFNVGVILSEMKAGRPAYMAKEELDVKNPKALGLPHGAVIAVGTLFFLAASAHFTK